MEALPLMSLQQISIIGVNNEMKIKEGDVIARVPKESSKTKDITGGLPRWQNFLRQEKQRSRNNR